MTETEAAELARQIQSDTGLTATVVGDARGAWSLDIDVPVPGQEVRNTVHVYDVDDWPWLYETHVRERIGR